MKVLICCPLRGKPKIVKKRLARARSDLEEMGCEVVDPSDVKFIGDFDWLDVHLRMVALMDEVEAIYLLSGWEEDRGCSSLYLIAEELGRHVLVEEYPKGVDRNAKPKGGD